MSDAVTVVGGGAIGGIAAAHLSCAGVDVTVVETDGAHRAAIRAGGLRLTGASELVARPRAIAPDELEGPLRTVLVAVKCPQTAGALDTLDGRLTGDALVVSLQNGFELYRLAERFGTERSAGAVVTVSGYLERPGTIVRSSVGALALGRLDGRRTPALARLRALLEPIGPVETTAEIRRTLWSKAAVGALWFATALVDEDVLAILGDERYLDALGALAGEVAETARSEGVDCQPVDGFDPLAFIDGAPAAARAESWRRHRAFWDSIGQTRTGVWRDLAVHRRQTEVDCIVGAVLGFGSRSGRDLARLRRLAELVHEVERGSRGLSRANLDELVAVHEAAGPAAG